MTRAAVHDLPLFAAPAAALGAARDAGIRKAEAHTSLEWRRRAYDAVVSCSIALRAFTADDVWDLISTNDHGAARNPSALGGPFRRAALAGLIEKTGRAVPTRYPDRRHRNLTEWQRATP